MPFTVEFEDDGTITKVHKGGITSLGNEVTTRQSGLTGPQMKKTIGDHLDGHKVKNITSVTIVQANPTYTCIMQGGDLICWQTGP